MKEKILVTSALPYANGPIHFGHIAGAYLPADIFVRFKRLAGADIVFICGTDEHGIPITISAEREGLTPKEYVDKYHKVIKNIFDDFNIEFDIFSRTTWNEHYDLAQDFFLNLLKKNLVKPKVTRQYYCSSCNKFLADRYVRGQCPKCGFEDARGDECTSCGSWLDVMEIKKPRCGLCDAPPEARETKHWYLQLQDLSGKLVQWLDTKKDWKENVISWVKSMIEEGLKERPITRDITWGVPVPLENTEGKVLYVWFDAPIGYISATREWAQKKGTPEEWRNYWLNPDCRIIHFIGKDNIPFHCIVWPSLIMGQDIKYNMPYDVPANEFYNFEGRQFSKSDNWYIDPLEFLKKYRTDSIRYTIAANAPETKDSEFTWKDFQLRNNSELANIYGNLAHRTLAFIEKYFEGEIPQPPEPLSQASLDARNEAHKLIDSLHACYSNYETRKACFNIMELGRLGNKYYDTEAPWLTRKNDMAKCAETMAVCCELIAIMAYVSFPVIPETAGRLWRMLGNRTAIEMIPWEKIKQIRPSGKLSNVAILFERIEDKTIQAELEQLHGKGKAEKQKKGEQDKDGAGLITIDDFKKVSLKTACIRSAEPVPKSSKLLKLKISMGDEERQVIAGIAKHYKPEELVGRNIIVVANLKPAKLMGELSQGMLLAAREGNNLCLLTADGDIGSGSSIS